MTHGHAINAAHAGEAIERADRIPFGQRNEWEQPQQPPASHVPPGAHEMPSGNWVRLSDPRALTRGDKYDLIQAVRDKDTVGEIGFAIADLLLTRLVTEWSYALPLPSADPAALYQIPGCDDEAISELIRPAKESLFPPAASPDQHDDPRSPTAPSSV